MHFPDSIEERAKGSNHTAQEAQKMWMYMYSVMMEGNRELISIMSPNDSMKTAEVCNHVESSAEPKLFGLPL